MQWGSCDLLPARREERKEEGKVKNMTTMVALVGEQPLPNFLPVLHYGPKNVLLLYTARTQQRFKYLQATLQNKANIVGLETDAYDIPKIADMLDQTLEERTAEPLQFNLTGGTKPMSLAAYQISQKRMASVIYLQSEGKETRVYEYTWEPQQLKYTGSELLPARLTLQDVFDLHFGPGNWKEEGPARAGGGAFEDALATILREAKYEVMVGVKAMAGQIDIDLAIRAGNRYGIIEAKMGEKGKKLDGVKQLSNAVRHLGTYSQTCYVITVPPEHNHKMITDASNIQVISLPSYTAGKTISEEDKEQLLSVIEKILGPPPK